MAARAVLFGFGFGVAAAVYLWKRHNMSLAKLKTLLIKTFMNRAIAKITGAGAELEVSTRDVAGGGKVRYYKNAPKTLSGWYEHGKKHLDKEVKHARLCGATADNSRGSSSSTRASRARARRISPMPPRLRSQINARPCCRCLASSPATAWGSA